MADQFCEFKDPTIYDVASNLAALHLDDVGMKVRICAPEPNSNTDLLSPRRLNGTTSLLMKPLLKPLGKESSGSIGTCASTSCQSLP